MGPKKIVLQNRFTRKSGAINKKFIKKSPNLLDRIEECDRQVHSLRAVLRLFVLSAIYLLYYYLRVNLIWM